MQDLFTECPAVQQRIVYRRRTSGAITPPSGDRMPKNIAAKLLRRSQSKHKDYNDEVTQAVRHYGLRNQGSTCYLNSVLQILFMTTEIHDRLDPEAWGTDYELKNLFEGLKKKTCGTEKITKTLGITNVYRQDDAALCLEKILHKVSPQVSQIFQGQLNDTTKCSEGHCIIEEENPFLILPLSLKDANDRNHDVVSRNYDVKRGFEDIFQNKSFGGDNMVFCNECGMKTEALSECQMGEFPPVLVLLLKRFDRDYITMTHVKSDRSVEVPGLLQTEATTYKLYGMVNHRGGLAGGHYTATILSEEDQAWYEFNDSHVRKLYAEEQPFANQRPYNSRTAYLLVYRAQQKLDDSFGAGMQSMAGDRCQVHVEGSGWSYDEIEEGPPDNGPVMVDIEELGQRKGPLRNSHPASDKNGWSVVVNRKKRTGKQHGEREEQGKGRGQGKHIPASSSAPFAPAQGSSGHVQKQHSCPPQATTEKQRGAKSTRKSISSVEPVVDLTEKRRIAKEERSVALVEIQQGDEQSSRAHGSQSGGSGDGGRKRVGEKRRSQTNKTKNPVEDFRALSPSAGERPKSSTPPITSTKPATKPPPADSDSTSALLKSNKASLPKTNMAASSEVTVKPKARSYASAAGAPPTSSALSAVAGGAVPSSASPFSFIPPVLPPASSSQTSNTVSSSSPPPPSSSPAPTFITPIALSPSAALSFLHSSPPCSSPPVSFFPHSPSPPPVSSTPLTMSGTQSLLNQTPLSQADPQVSDSQTQNPVLFTSVQYPPSLPQNQTTYSLIQNQTPVPQKQIGPPEFQSQPESSTDVTQITPSIPQTSLPKLHYPPQSSPDIVQAQPPVSITHPDPQVQPPAPSQVPHPSLSMPPSQPPAESPPHLSHPDPPPTQPLPPPPQQQLSQLCQGPLYPGLPQGEKGQVLQTPVISSSRSREDLPQEVKGRRSFLHPGVKNPKIPSRSPSSTPSPQYLPNNPQPRPEESYPPLQYHSTSSSMHPQYDRQAPHTEPPKSSDPSHNQAWYPMTHPPPNRMSPPRNQSSALGYPFQNTTYSFPQQISQGYQTSHNPGHSLYQSGPSYHTSLMGYQSPSPYEEQHPSGNPVHEPRPLQATIPLKRPPISNTAGGSRTRVLPGFGNMTRYGDGMNRALLMQESPVYNNHMLVSNQGDFATTSMKPHSTPGSLTLHESISVASNPLNYNNSFYGYQSYQKLPNTPIPFVPRGASEGATTRRYRGGESRMVFGNAQYNTSNRGRGRGRGGY